MLPRHQRINGKTVQYLLRRRQVVHARYFSFWYVKQYPGREGGQRGAFVPKKIHKSAVVRNRLRRVIYNCVREHDLVRTLPWRCFVRPNMRVAEQWSQLIASGDQKSIQEIIARWFASDSRFLEKKLCQRRSR